MSHDKELHNRRSFIGAVGGAAVLSVATAGSWAATVDKKKEAGTMTNMRLGIIMNVADPDADIARVRELGFGTCQMSVSDYSDDFARKLREALTKHTVDPTSLICMGPGPYKWNFYEGPETIGLVPRQYRAERTEQLHKGANFCKIAGIPALLAHFGFIPENPNDVLYDEFITMMKSITGYAADRGIEIHFETGQETPITLIRAIEDIGAGNVGVNLDTANLILYGKANPVDALDIIGTHVRSLHAKDGFYPTDPRELGREVPIGEGKVDFPAVIKKLKALKFRGNIIIEREISGPRQVEDILKSKTYLESLIAAG